MSKIHTIPNRLICIIKLYTKTYYNDYDSETIAKIIDNSDWMEVSHEQFYELKSNLNRLPKKNDEHYLIIEKPIKPEEQLKLTLENIKEFVEKQERIRVANQQKYKREEEAKRKKREEKKALKEALKKIPEEKLKELIKNVQ